MLATSVWNLSDFWKVGKRANIYLMMFLVVAVLVMPLVQPQEAGAPLATGTVLGIAGIVIGLSALGYAVYTNLCGGSCKQHDVDHSTVCPADHPFYTCNLDERWHHGRCSPSDRN